MRKLQKGDLVEPTRESGGYYHAMLSTPRDAEWIGVVTDIVNDTMVPPLVEVTWNNGIVLKYYADDLILLNVKKN